MDNAVALVQAYLRVNGYFTITEVPLIESLRSGFRAATDLDVLAYRLADAVPEPREPGGDGGRSRDGRRRRRIESDEQRSPDAELDCDPTHPDMLIGEVKEGRARLNQGARDPEVLAAALMRFGCCTEEQARISAVALRKRGETRIHAGHRVRLLAFGAAIEEDARTYRQISLGHVTGFLQSLLRRRWRELRHTQFKDPALGFLMTLEKARRAQRRDRPSAKAGDQP